MSGRLLKVSFGAFCGALMLVSAAHAESTYKKPEPLSPETVLQEAIYRDAEGNKVTVHTHPGGKISTQINNEPFSRIGNQGYALAMRHGVHLTVTPNGTVVGQNTYPGVKILQKPRDMHEQSGGKYAMKLMANEFK